MWKPAAAVEVRPGRVAPATGLEFQGGGAVWESIRLALHPGPGELYLQFSRPFLAGLIGAMMRCAPGALGVCIGSDRAHGYDLAKMQLLRTLDDGNPDAAPAKLEADIMQQANTLGVGAMGFGGAASLIG